MTLQEISQTRGSSSTQPMSSEFQSWNSESERLYLLRATLKEVVREIGALGITYNDLEKRSGVRANAIKQFMHRPLAQPRPSAIDHQLVEVLQQLAKHHRFSSSRAFAKLNYYSLALGNCLEDLRDQLSRFYSYFLSRETAKSCAGEFVSSIYDTSSAFAELRFFCISRCADDPRLEKSEYTFFRDGRISRDECFFKRTRPNKTVQYGIVRLSHDLISLYSFDRDSELRSTAHVKCVHADRKAYGVSIVANKDNFSLNGFLLLPEDVIENKYVEYLELTSNAFEVAEYRISGNKIYSFI